LQDVAYLSVVTEGITVHAKTIQHRAQGSNSHGKELQRNQEVNLLVSKIFIFKQYEHVSPSLVFICLFSDVYYLNLVLQGLNIIDNLIQNEGFASNLHQKTNIFL